IEFGLKTVFVHPYYVEYAYETLTDHTVVVAASIGVSLRVATTLPELVETKDGIQTAQSQIENLINLDAYKSEESDVVQHDISEVVKQAGDLTTKVIIETALLTDEEKVTAC